MNSPEHPNDEVKSDVASQFTASSASGTVKPVGNFDDFGEQIRQAKEERAERLVRSMRCEI